MLSSVVVCVSRVYAACPGFLEALQLTLSTNVECDLTEDHAHAPKDYRDPWIARLCLFGLRRTILDKLYKCLVSS